MLNMRQQSVNVSRLELIAALEKGLEMHRAQFMESLADYKAAVVKFMGEAYERAQAGNFKNLTLMLREPENHEADYLDIIEMMQVSVDDTIQLDKESYKAFYRNEWSWSSNLIASAIAYKTALGGQL